MRFDLYLSLSLSLSLIGDCFSQSNERTKIHKFEAPRVSHTMKSVVENAPVSENLKEKSLYTHAALVHESYRASR